MTTRAEEIAGDGPYRVEWSGENRTARVSGPGFSGPWKKEGAAVHQCVDMNMAYKQGQQDRWIPVSEGARPNIGDEILILRQRIADTPIAYIIRYLTTEDIDERTTHWMPRPPNPRTAMSRPVFSPVHIDTPERFVGFRDGVRYSIALGDMGLWEVDAYRGPNCLVDQYVTGKDMDQAIARTMALVTRNETLKTK